MTLEAAQSHLAQINIAHMLGSWDDPVMEEFVARLDEVNAVADASPGFVWRMQAEDDEAMARRLFGDPRVLINMSLWESIEALRDFTYGSGHLEVLRDRRKWFRPMSGASLALWWVPAGHIPPVDEGKAGLDTLDRIGPSPAAFTFKQPFPPPAVLNCGSGRGLRGKTMRRDPW